MIIKLSSMYPSMKQMERIVRMIMDGALCCYPTDTVYAVGCSLEFSKQIDLIYKLKKNPRKNKPLSIILNNISQVSEYASVDNWVFRILKKFLPGPYTFVLPARRTLPKALFNNKTKTIGIRIPNNNICSKIVELSGSPMITTSMRSDSSDILNDPYEIERLYKGHIDLVIDGGELYTRPSTVIDFTGGLPEILREGEGIDEWYHEME